jgi:hypothetical protein
MRKKKETKGDPRRRVTEEDFRKSSEFLRGLNNRVIDAERAAAFWKGLFILSNSDVGVFTATPDEINEAEERFELKINDGLPDDRILFNIEEKSPDADVPPL